MHGYTQSSPRDTRLRQFVADGPGIAGYKLSVDPEEDGDAFAASFDPFLTPQGVVADLRLNRANDWAHIGSLEALADLGVEFADPASLDTDDDRDEEEIQQRRPGGEVAIWAPLPSWQQVQKRAAAVVIDSRDAVRTAKAELRRKAEETKKPAAKSEPAKGNGNGHKPVAPPVGKYLAGTVVDQGPKGLLVDIGNGMEARVPIALEMGHGSWERAADWILGFKPGASVRIRVIRVNGVIEAVLSDRHPRPFWKKEASEQIEASPAN